MKLLYTLGPAVILLALFSCTPDQLAEADQLERTLLITWIALERNAPNIAADYNETAQYNWAVSRGQYRDLPLQADQKRSLELLDGWMDNLDFSIRYGKRDQALASIRLIQNEIRSIRPPGEGPYPTDQLYGFSLNWAEVREASHDQMMCLLDWSEFAGLYERAEQQWQRYQRTAMQAPTGTTLPGLGSNSREAEARALALTAALDEFGIILRQGNHTLARKPGDRIQQLFIDYLAVATDYPSTEPMR